MKPGPQTVLAVGIGYLLGRTKKMRLALMIAAAGATGKFGGGPRQLLQQGIKRLAASPEFGKITESVRGELLESAKSAAMTAASSRIESLNSRLTDQISAPTKRKRAKDDEPDDELEDYDEDVDEYEDEEPEAKPARRKRSSNGAAKQVVRRARR